MINTSESVWSTKTIWNDSTSLTKYFTTTDSTGTVSEVYSNDGILYTNVSTYESESVFLFCPNLRSC